MIFEDPRKEFGLILVFLASITAGLHLTGYLGVGLRLFSDPQYLQETVTAYREFGVFILLALQIVNNVLAPLPGQAIGVAYGLIYGVYWGTFFGMIGTTIGTTIAILASKRYGQPLVTSIIGKKRFEKYSKITESADVWPFVILIVLPVIPDDAIGYIAGLTSLDKYRLIFWLSLARFPGMFALAWAGDAAGNADWPLLGALLLVITVVSLWVVWKRNWIMARLSADSAAE